VGFQDGLKALNCPKYVFLVICSETLLDGRNNIAVVSTSENTIESADMMSKVLKLFSSPRSSKFKLKR